MIGPYDGPVWRVEPGGLPHRRAAANPAGSMWEFADEADAWGRCRFNAEQDAGRARRVHEWARTSHMPAHYVASCERDIADADALRAVAVRRLRVLRGLERAARRLRGEAPAVPTVEDEEGEGR